MPSMSVRAEVLPKSAEISVVAVGANRALLSAERIMACSSYYGSASSRLSEKISRLGRADPGQ
jgi:hypothetical protein